MNTSQTDLPQKSWWQSLKPFLDRRVLILMALGLSSGLPLTLIFDTLSVWLRDEGVSLSTIGYFSLATFSYSLKFVWAPLVDRISIFGLSRLLGNRRAWILVCQAIITLGLWVISTLDPAKSLETMALFAVLTGFAGATQDIVIDAYRIELAGLSEDNQAVLATGYAWGARVATFASGIIPFYIAKELNWHIAYAVMAGMMGLGIFGTLAAPRGPEPRVRPIDYGEIPANSVLEALEWLLRLMVIGLAVLLMGSGLTANLSLAKPLFALFEPGLASFNALESVWKSKEQGIFLQFPAVLAGLLIMVLACLPAFSLQSRPGAYLRQSFVIPMADFFSTYGRLSALILAMICFYRLSDNLLNINAVFYRDLGFDLDVIANVRKIYGVIMTIVGVTLGGVLVTRLGLNKALIIGAIMGALSNLAYAWLATKGPDLMAFSIALMVDNVSGGVAGTVLIVFMSSLISQSYAAPQYALLSSLYALPGKLLASQSGRIVETLAQTAQSGGLAQSLIPFMSGLDPSAYIKPAASMGITPAALGASYALFFIYTTLVGVLSVAFALWLVRKPLPSIESSKLS
jgi:PAT family beta-lactamase induction signal transducer AmpG